MKRSVVLFLLVVPLFLLFAAAPLRALAQGEFPPADGEALLNYILNENPYTEWGMWPTEDLQGLLDSGAPHGGVVRIFVNDVALSVAEEFPGEMPAHSIIVKENFTGEEPAAPDDLADLTVMYKVPGFAPETGNWFWLKSSADGSTIDAEGAVEGCISCHGGVEGHRDYILRYGFGGEPALASAEQLDTDESAAPPAEETAPETAEAAPETLPESGGSFEWTYIAAFFILSGLIVIGAATLLRRSRLT